MPTPIIANATRVTVSGLCLGQVVENVWGVQTGAPPTVGELSNINDIFHTAYGSLLLPMSAAMSIGEITSRYLGDATGPEVTLSITPPMLGLVEVDPNPNNVALCVSLRSALAGRRFRGRKYFSGIPKPDATGNTISTAFCDAIVDVINTWIIGELNSNGTPLSIISLTGLTLVPVLTALCVDNFVDSQRRRLTGRGR